MVSSVVSDCQMLLLPNSYSFPFPYPYPFPFPFPFPYVPVRRPSVVRRPKVQSPKPKAQSRPAASLATRRSQLQAQRQHGTMTIR
jgi:hypothetical protein